MAFCIAKVEPLAQALGDAFYVDVEAIQDAIRRRSSLNAIHQETMPVVSSRWGGAFVT